MLAALGLFLAVIWLVAFITMETASLAIHVLLAFAAISLIGHLVRRASSTTGRSAPLA